VKNLVELQAECDSLGIPVATKGRTSKEPYVAALREYHWRKDHPDKPLPMQTMPMLLGSWQDLDEDQAEAIEHDHHAWVVQPKLDGVRALVHIEDGRVRITSRTVSEVTYRLSEFQDNLPHLSVDLSGLSGCILDGELVCPVSNLHTGSTVTGSSLQATMAVLAAAPNKARQFQEGQNAHVRFHVFDILRFCGRDVTPLPLIERQEVLTSVTRKLDNGFVVPVPYFVVNKTDIHRRIIDAGGEGTVWKRTDSPYEPGRRVSHWIKRKRGIEVAAFVSGFKPGTNKHQELIGALEFSQAAPNGRPHPVAWVSNFSDELHREMTATCDGGSVRLNPEFLGRRAVILGQEMSAKSSRVSHARIRNWL
jgi:bifunctional non-homologous end joining protein LigD